MGTLPALPLLLLLLGLGLRAPQAQGLPVNITFKKCQIMVKEIQQLLNMITLRPGELDPEEVGILTDESNWRANLDAFLNAIIHFQKEDVSKIERNLRAFKLTPTSAEPTAPPISIEEKDWDDFGRKLDKYLDVLCPIFARSEMTTVSNKP
ncbi:interleukin-3 [Dasypus novemcinctus]|uniref:interleukin-3 n=1 Tax=Dasypus novemcinctus TaxID=9361 RepID=UPI00265FEFE7|nr:interleukin-3-like [Dasypus novemcinctus]